MKIETSSTQVSLGSLSSYVKQYWPVWVYKMAFIGAGISEYSFKRCDVALGIAGSGLVANYALSYFFSRKQEKQPMKQEKIPLLNRGNYIT